MCKALDCLEHLHPYTTFCEGLHLVWKREIGQSHQTKCDTEDSIAVLFCMSNIVASGKKVSHGSMLLTHIAPYRLCQCLYLEVVAL